MGSTVIDHTLYLLRHAKSSWDEPLPDHERPLSSRGIRDARAAGRLLAERGWRAELVLCSTAVRTRQTWQHARAAGAEAGDVRYDENIYEASIARLVGLIQHTPQEVGSLMLIGHGPGLPALADWLGRRPEPRDAWARMDAKYPTAGLAVLRLPRAWAGADAGEAELLAFEVPRG
jgi:phosphohistidine phosphatase